MPAQYVTPIKDKYPQIVNNDAAGNHIVRGRCPSLTIGVAHLLLCLKKVQISGNGAQGVDYVIDDGDSDSATSPTSTLTASWDGSLTWRKIQNISNQ